MELAALLLPAFALQTPVIDNFTASYPIGTQIGLEVTPDGRRAFVARGAAVSVLDLVSGGSTLLPPIDTVEVPECSPMAMVFHEHPSPSGSAVRQLFVAGGTLGLWRLTLCDNLFLNTPVGCNETSSALR